jgi:hypothetical protein
MDPFPPSSAGAADAPKENFETMRPIHWGRANLTVAAGPPVAWLWHGMLLPGTITLFTSEWKSGKTTLASVLLARLGVGGKLAGLAVETGKALVVSEEDPALWRMRCEDLDIGDHVGWCCRPFRSRPTLKAWLRFIDGLVEEHARAPFDFVLVDPLAAFLPGCENSPGAVMDALLPLRGLTARRVSVLVMHHPAKGDPPVGQASRGTGALDGTADIVIEMRYFHRAGDADRRRRLWGLSRYPQTPRHLVIEWSPDGKDYLSHGTFEDEQFSRMWRRLRSVCADAPRKLTRAELHERWKHGRKPDGRTLRRWLEQAVAQGLLRQDGQGLRGKAFRYWLPAKEEEWRKDAWACHLMPELLENKEDLLLSGQ